MLVLALDLSTKTGYALLRGEFGQKPEVLRYGKLANGCPVKEFGQYPWSYLDAAGSIVEKVQGLLSEVAPVDAVVVEETNKARSVFSQKILEFIHCQMLAAIRWAKPRVVYIQSEHWRRTLGLLLSKDDRRNNAKVSKAGRIAAERGGTITEAKKRLGVRGRINKKHLALRYVDERFGLLGRKMKNNDEADAICLGDAFLQGAPHCTGE